MKCPVCKSHKHSGLDLHSEQHEGVEEEIVSHRPGRLDVFQLHRDRLRLEQADPDRQIAIGDRVMKNDDREIGRRVQHQRLHVDGHGLDLLRHSDAIVRRDTPQVKRVDHRPPGSRF